MWERLCFLLLPSAPSECCCLASIQVVTLADYDRVEEATKDGAKKSPSPGYPLICVTPCDPHFPKYAVTKERCGEAGINQSSIQFSWEVATPTDGNGARSPFETITDNTPFTSVNHKVRGWVLARKGCRSTWQKSAEGLGQLCRAVRCVITHMGNLALKKSGCA